jgi:hypothetical protein
MKFTFSFLSLYIIYLIIHLITCSDSEYDRLFTKEEMADFLNNNHTDYLSECEEASEINTCYEKSIQTISQYKFFDPKFIEKMEDFEMRDYYTSYNHMLS